MEINKHYRIWKGGYLTEFIGVRFNKKSVKFVLCKLQHRANWTRLPFVTIHSYNHLKKLGYNFALIEDCDLFAILL